VVDPRAEPMRRLALEKCAGGDWKPCVDGLDEARRLDPAGDARPEVKQARDAAANALKLQPAPSPSALPTGFPSALPTTTPPNPAPSSNLSPSPTPSPDDSAPRLNQKRGPTAPPSKSDSFDSLSAPTAPVPTPTPQATPVPTAEATSFTPTKSDAPQATKTVAKPQGKRASPTKPSAGGSNLTPDPSSDGAFGGGGKK
jgi:hypothetical protein